MAEETLTVRDNRTENEVEIPISDGTIHAVSSEAQWEEVLSDSELRVARPRQIYTRYDERDFVPLASC